LMNICFRCQIGELKKLVDEGKIKYIGLSEPSASTIRRAHAVHPISAVQIEWSLWSRDVEEEVIPTCRYSRTVKHKSCTVKKLKIWNFELCTFRDNFREHGIGIVAYSPLGRGFFSSGSKMVESLSDDDYRKVNSNWYLWKLIELH